MMAADRRQKVTEDHVRGLLGMGRVDGWKERDRVVREITQDAPGLAYEAGVDVDCAIKVLSVLESWEVPDGIG
jgi:hypothetical protein